jgi:hypothetical protein
VLMAACRKLRSSRETEIFTELLLGAEQMEGGVWSMRYLCLSGALRLTDLAFIERLVRTSGQLASR